MHAAAKQPKPNGSSKSLWSFVPLTDYELPGMQGITAAKERWGRLKSIFRRQTDQEKAPVMPEASLNVLPPSVLSQLAPALPWSAALPALENCLAGWPEGPKICFFVAQHQTGMDTILQEWAKQKQATIICSPSCEQILHNPQGWLNQWPKQAKHWVLPHLEYCYYRHAQGFTLLRQILDNACSGNLGQGIIVCHSWAWAFIRHLWPGLKQEHSYTLQSFSGHSLAHLLNQCVSPPEHTPIRFCQAKTGQEILRLPLPDTEAAEVSDEMQKLAAHYRGNVALAWQAWERRLRSAPEKEEISAADNEQSSIWISGDFQEPKLPESDAEVTALLLHALLMHNGLPQDLLPLLLPFAWHRLASRLYELAKQGVLYDDGHRWQVAGAALIPVRNFLSERDYQLDDF
jgi:hypothetical protein